MFLASPREIVLLYQCLVPVERSRRPFPRGFFGLSTNVTLSITFDATGRSPSSPHCINPNVRSAGSDEQSSDGTPSDPKSCSLGIFHLS